MWRWRHRPPKALVRRPLESTQQGVALATRVSRRIRRDDNDVIRRHVTRLYMGLCPIPRLCWSERDQQDA